MDSGCKEIIGLRSALLSYDWLALGLQLKLPRWPLRFPLHRMRFRWRSRKLLHTMLSSMIDEVVSESQWAKNGEIGNVDTSLGTDSQQVLEQVSMYDFKSSDWRRRSRS